MQRVEPPKTSRKGRAHEDPGQRSPVPSVDRLAYFVMPWALLAFVFAVNLVIVSMIQTGPHQNIPVGGLPAFT